MDYYSLYSGCTLCPRDCKVDRSNGKVGFCRETDKLRIAWAGLHFGEEPVITGNGGSGTVFFTGCTLKCVFCQNYQISHEGLGRVVRESDLIDIFFGLQRMGAENINIVTGTHFIPHIISALDKARDAGLNLPVVWNTSGYEKRESIGVLLEFVDIFLTDVKTLDSALARSLFGVSDYPEKVVAAVDAMVDSKKFVVEDGIIKEGVIIRHLVLPGMIDSTLEFLDLFKQRWYGRAVLSLMFQYSPPHRFFRLKGIESEVISKLKTYLLAEEYSRVMRYLEDLGIDEGYIHEIDEDDEWLPDFTKERPFPHTLCNPLWHI